MEKAKISSSIAEMYDVIDRVAEKCYLDSNNNERNDIIRLGFVDPFKKSLRGYRGYKVRKERLLKFLVFMIYNLDDIRVYSSFPEVAISPKRTFSFLGKNSLTLWPSRLEISIGFGIAQDVPSKLDRYTFDYQGPIHKLVEFFEESFRNASDDVHMRVFRSNQELYKWIASSFMFKGKKKTWEEIAYSGPNLPLIPAQTCHPFRAKVATHSG